MGGKKSSGGTTVTNTTQQATPTVEETELNRLQIEGVKATQPAVIENQLAGLNLSNLLLTGQDLPGNLGTLPTGISDEDIDDIARESVRDIPAAFQSQGLVDSGVAQVASARVSGDVRRASREFNIGALQNLLNLASGGSAQVQGVQLGQGGQLGQRLAGLRAISGTSSSKTTGFTRDNPFLRSFSQAAGSKLGGRVGGANPFDFFGK